MRVPVELHGLSEGNLIAVDLAFGNGHFSHSPADRAGQGIAIDFEIEGCSRVCPLRPGTCAVHLPVISAARAVRESKPRRKPVVISLRMQKRRFQNGECYALAMVYNVLTG